MCTQICIYAMAQSLEAENREYVGRWGMSPIMLTVFGLVDTVRHQNVFMHHLHN